MIVTALFTYYETDSALWFSFKAGDTKNIEGLFDEYCCNKMEKAIDDEFIGFGDIDAVMFNKIYGVCIYKCIPYPEGASFKEMVIKYCPFCREEIKIIGEEA